MFQATKSNCLLKSGKQYNTTYFDTEKNRISDYFRNNGVYHFQPNNVTFDIDTISKENKASVNLMINDYSYQQNDSTKTEPFKIYKISDVHIYTDYSPTNTNTISDSTLYNNFHLYSNNKLKYKPRAITGCFYYKRRFICRQQNRFKLALFKQP